MANVAKINLNVLRQNAEKIKSRLSSGVKFCAVVKADAYGHGAEECASALYKMADCFAVALAEEGIRLRLSGIDKDILVLTPTKRQDLARAIEYNLTLSASSVKEISEIEKESLKQGKRTKIHLSYNTGMNRLGITGLKELKKILAFTAEQSAVILEGFYSHFANPENKKDRTDALNKFLLAKKLIKSYNNNIICHISSSGGFLAGIEEDMVRIGILLYGYTPFKCVVDVKPVMKVYSRIVASRTLTPGDGALYGLKKPKKKTQIAIVRCGYADGFFRQEAGDRFNNRCMDLSAIKTARKRGVICVMDNAEVLAKEHQTISYEILCSVACRAEKIYVR